MFLERLRPGPSLYCCVALLILCGEDRAACGQTAAAAGQENFQATRRMPRLRRAKQARRTRLSAITRAPLRFVQNGRRAGGTWERSQYDRDHYPEAIPALRKLVQLSPDLGPAWSFLGLSEFETKDYANSLADLQKAQSIGSEDDPELAVSRRIIWLFCSIAAANLNGHQLCCFPHPARTNCLRKSSPRWAWRCCAFRCCRMKSILLRMR